MGRLPPAQVNQHVIQGFKHQKIGKRRGRVGGTGHRDERQPEGQKNNISFDNTPGAYRPIRSSVITGWTTPVLQRRRIRSAAGSSMSAASIKSKPINTDKFKETVLHEVGHSVDTLLGDKTDLVYGAAGWKMHGIDQFEQWATEMGGLDGIDSKDRAQIRRGVAFGLRSGTSIEALVEPTHPARASKYASSPLVKAATENSTRRYPEKRRANGRVWLTGNTLGTIGSVPEATADVAPSAYSLSAPQEFFAECYVEYYRDYDGTPSTEHLKGGHLAPWIKQWFDLHVDRIQLSPARLHKTESATGAMPNKARTS